VVEGFLTSSSRQWRHSISGTSGRRRLGPVLQATGLTRPSSGRATAGFARRVTPLKSNVRLAGNTRAKVRVLA